MSLRWMPIESNPDIMNSFLKDLGLCESWGLTEIISLDPDAAYLVPKPCLAVILLLPITKEYNKFIRQLENLNEGNPVLLSDPAEPYFIKQMIKNACGTIALIHAVANNMDRLELLPDCILGKFLESTRHLSPEDRGRKLKDDIDIANLHKAVANEGQGNLAGGNDDVDLHFITFVNYRNNVLELDGYKSEPIVHVVTDEENFVKDAFRVVQNYMNIDPCDSRYNVLSLGPICQSSVNM